MASIDEQILRTAKEIVVKFIEVSRVSPTTFDESFRSIYHTVHSSVCGNRSTADTADQETGAKKG
jgi:hypothetical protein